ncbi:hypothetical protein BDM02DRAFT_3111631 [Thelephora ganbajun]|uniref:Uncharacterized protein n=1 Tax=Thelephora ganbajun TaxID=370292 RepID=A0ACB6ZN21_THEGA|nr:hypothetical protein BDM02DRAFT_3111631 [Thelephora ganbajun]
MSRARTSEHRNAEAGPSTLVPPPTPYAGPSTSQPSGGSISETTANAATKQTITEEAEVPVSSLYCSHIPRVTEWSFGVRGPRGPGAPAARVQLASTASHRGKTPLSCASGCRGERSSRKLRALTGL